MKRLIKRTVKVFLLGNVVVYTTYKLKLDEKLIRAIEPSYINIVSSLKSKAE